MQKKKPFVFFDLGQTLIDEWEFINHFDVKFLEVLNGFGARIDRRNYTAVRDSIIRDRMIGRGGVRELIIEVCRMLSPPGYGAAIARRLEPEIAKGRKELFRLFEDAGPTLNALADMGYEMGVIANQAGDVFELMEKTGIGSLLKVKVVSSAVGLKKPDLEIFQMAFGQAGRAAGECVMIGDRLDTDICPANTLGMAATIRTTNSLFALQKPATGCEQPSHTVSRLSEIPALLNEGIVVS